MVLIRYSKFTNYDTSNDSCKQRYKFQCEILKPNFQGKFILTVVTYQNMERISSKQEDLMNFVNGGMMKKVEMQYVFVTVMVAI